MPKIPYLLLAVCLIGVGAIGFANSHVVAKQLKNWHVLPQPERMSELYFTDHHALFKSSPQVSFTVHNLEHQRTAYRYTLAILHAGTRTEQQLGEGTLILDHDQTEVVQRPLAIPVVSTRTAVKITLEYMGIKSGDHTPRTQTQSIHYWLKDRG